MATFVGIDVGGKRKGFHGVALDGSRYRTHATLGNSIEVVNWVTAMNPDIVAIDAPSGWSKSNGRSRASERDLHREGVHCFFTPSNAMRKASKSKSWNYEWIANAHEVYARLRADYPLFDRTWRAKGICIESYPHAVECALGCDTIVAKRKVARRRELLDQLGIENKLLPNIDYVDAALCAITALRFSVRKYRAYGDRNEGFIVVPSA